VVILSTPGQQTANGADMGCRLQAQLHVHRRQMGEQRGAVK
jgi:hypothetical protein